MQMVAIENKLLKECLGYNVVEKSIVRGENGRLYEIECSKHVPPNPKAIERWLHKRRSAEWY